MITYSANPQNTPEWWADKSGLIGASSAGVIVGKGSTREKLIQKLAAQRMFNLVDTDSGYKSAHMQRGHDMEPATAAMCETHCGLLLQEVGLCTNTDWPGCGVSLDRLDIGGKIAAELKSVIPTTIFSYHEYAERNPEKQPAYRYQVAMQMLIADLDEVVMFAYAHDSNDWYAFRNTRNDCKELDAVADAIRQANADITATMKFHTQRIEQHGK